MTRPAALLLVAVVVLYGATLDHFFVSDDFLNLERNSFRTIGEALGFFSIHDVDFYRPIPRLHFGILQGLFADRVLIWNLVGVLLHGIVAVAVTVLASSLLGDDHRRAARWAGLFFAVHFIHVEPVVWASGVTSLWVTLFLLLGLVLHRRAERLGSARDFTLATVAYFLALLSKETAVVFLPLLLLVTAVWPGVDRDGRPLSRLPSLGSVAPYLILTAIYGVVVARIDRGGAASPYQVGLGPHVLKNAAFFYLGSFVPVRYWEVQELWTRAATEGGGLAGFGIELLRRPALGPPLLVGAVGIAAALRRGGRGVRGGLAWIGVAAIPFLLLPGSGERFLYLPSVGASIALGVGAQSLLRRGRDLPGGLPTARVLVGAVLALMIWGNLDRQGDWMTASRWTRGICGRWTYFRELDPDRPIEFVGIPDSWRSAWVFRNGFDSMARLYWEGRLYRREGRMPAGAPAPTRMEVFLKPGGAVGMHPIIGSADLDTPSRPSYSRAQ
jgi:hypothetical protein